MVNNAGVLLEHKILKSAKRLSLGVRLEDEENGQTKEIILDKTRKKYGEALSLDEFPCPEERDGY